MRKHNKYNVKEELKVSACSEMYVEFQACFSLKAIFSNSLRKILQTLPDLLVSNFSHIFNACISHGFYEKKIEINKVA